MLSRKQAIYSNHSRAAENFPPYGRTVYAPAGRLFNRLKCDIRKSVGV